MAVRICPVCKAGWNPDKDGPICPRGCNARNRMRVNYEAGNLPLRR